MKQLNVSVHPAVRTALRRGHPVVALESAVITTGLPRSPFTLPDGMTIDGWNETAPANLALAQLLDHTVRAHGAIPATIAVLDGRLHIGLTDEQLHTLAANASAGKTSVAKLASTISRGLTAGTTVAATLLACHLTDAEPIRVFATGGIGGIHPHWQTSPDISADLRAIATTQSCIVCAGAKSILDTPATLAALEALSVPVVGWRSNFFAQFYASGDGLLPLSQRVESVHEAAQICAEHWFTLLQNTGILLSNPIEDAFALDPNEVANALAEAAADAEQHSITGDAITPFLLAQLVRRTQGRSLAANVALLRSNSALAAQLAVELARRGR